MYISGVAFITWMRRDWGFCCAAAGIILCDRWFRLTSAWIINFLFSWPSWCARHLPSCCILHHISISFLTLYVTFQPSRVHYRRYCLMYTYHFSKTFLLRQYFALRCATWLCAFHFPCVAHSNGSDFYLRDWNSSTARPSGQFGQTGSSDTATGSFSSRFAILPIMSGLVVAVLSLSIFFWTSIEKAGFRISVTVHFVPQQDWLVARLLSS